MRRFLGAVLVTTFGLSLVGPIRADEKDAKAIVDKAIRALGAEEKLNKASAITWKIKGKFLFGENENHFTGQVLVQDLDHYRSLFVGEFNGSAFKADTVLRGDNGWRTFMDDRTIMDQSALAIERRNLYLLVTPFNLVLLKGKDFQSEVAGEEKVGGRAAVILKVTGPDRKNFKLSFDKQTGLLVKQVAKSLGFMGDEFTQERVYSDYKVFDGIKRPTKIVSTRDDDKFAEEEIIDFKVLSKVDPKVFTEAK
jgi:hypothetical protein